MAQLTRPTSLVDVISQYENLLHLSRHLSYPDIRSLGQTNKDLRSLSWENGRVRRKLKSLTTCSGAGLSLRRRLMNLSPCGYEGNVEDEKEDDDMIFTASEEENWDPDVNFRICRPYEAKACTKCGEPTCEACRSAPRVATEEHDLPRDMFTDVPSPPHKAFTGRFQYLVAFCTDCDPDMQAANQRHNPAAVQAVGSQPSISASVVGANMTASFLSSLHTSAVDMCDCDRHTRWICHACQEAEKKEYIEHTRHHFMVQKAAGNNADSATQQNTDDGMFLPWITKRGSSISMMICPCGRPAHRTSHLWCFLCRRRHRSVLSMQQNGLPWRRLWHGPDDAWDRDMSM